MIAIGQLDIIIIDFHDESEVTLAVSPNSKDAHGRIPNSRFDIRLVEVLPDEFLTHRDARAFFAAR